MTEDFVIKYFWSACGYSLMSIPILFPAVKKEGHSQVADRTESESRLDELMQVMYQIDDYCYLSPMRAAGSCTRARISRNYPATPAVSILSSPRCMVSTMTFTPSTQTSLTTSHMSMAK